MHPSPPRHVRGVEARAPYRRAFLRPARPRGFPRGTDRTRRGHARDRRADRDTSAREPRGRVTLRALGENAAGARHIAVTPRPRRLGGAPRWPVQTAEPRWARATAASRSTEGPETPRRRGYSRGERSP